MLGFNKNDSSLKIECNIQNLSSQSKITFSLLNFGNQSKQVAPKFQLSNYNKPRLPLGRTVIQFVFASASCSSEILALVRLAPHRLAPRRLALLR